MTNQPFHPSNDSAVKSSKPRPKSERTDEEDVVISTPRAVAVRGLADSDHTAILFKFAAGTTGISIPNCDLAPLAEKLIFKASQRPAGIGGSAQNTDTAVKPIVAHSVAVDIGEGDGEVLLTFHLGGMELAFSLNGRATRSLIEELNCLYAPVLESGFTDKLDS